MQIRGNTQILAGTITADRLASNLGLALTQLAVGADIILRDGSIAFTNNQSMGGFRLTNVGTPTANTDAANKAYVDSVASGLDPKASVRAATTGAISLTGTQTIDGVALSVGDRVLVKDQVDATTNGIYVVAAGAWARAADADANNEVSPGMFMFVEEGTLNADSGWVLSTNGTITLGTSALTFVKFTQAASIAAGAGLVQNGNTYDVVAGDDSLTVNADNLVVKRSATGAIGLVVGQGLAVNVDGTTIEISGNALRLAAVGANSGLTGGGGIALGLNLGGSGGLQLTAGALGIKLNGSSLNLSASGLKIADPGAGNILMGNASGVLTPTAMSGDGSLSATGVLTLATTIARKVDYVGSEVLGGTPNGVLTTFTLANTPIAGTLEVYQNGLLLRPTTEYTISGTTVTLITAPSTGDVIMASYMK